MTFILAICSVQKAPVQKNRLLSINGVVPPSHSVAPLLHIHTFPARRTDKTPSGQNYLGQTPSDVTPSSRLRLMPGRSLCLEGVMYGGFCSRGFCPEGVYPGFFLHISCGTYLCFINHISYCCIYIMYCNYR